MFVYFRERRWTDFKKRELEIRLLRFILTRRFIE